ncbi:hypothetical protein R6Q59_015548 [Mikania micrantha]
MESNIQETQDTPRGIVKNSPKSGREHYIPDVHEDLKPKFEKIFDSLDNAYVLYKKYAAAGGFFISKATEYYTDPKGEKNLKYLVCSKKGVNKPKKVDTLEDSYKQKIYSVY